MVETWKLGSRERPIFNHSHPTCGYDGLKVEQFRPKAVSASQPGQEEWPEEVKGCSTPGLEHSDSLLGHQGLSSLGKALGSH